jgi:hypothetical protein
MDRKEHFINNNLKFIPKSKQKEVIELLDKADSTALAQVNGISFKKPKNWFLLYWFFPLMWIFDRLFLGQWITGIIKIVFAMVMFVMFFGDTEGFLWSLLLSLIVILYDTISLNYRVKLVNYWKVKKILC